jgi:hypothetical protein
MEGKFVCKYCDKEYSSSQSRSNHYNKFHKKVEEKVIIKGEYNCGKCKKSYANRHSKWKHERNCKNKNLLEDKINKIENYFEEIKELIKKKEDNKKESNINTQLINLIVDKSKTIEELKNKIEVGENNFILYKKENNYINATHLCKSENKTFEDWYNLESTKEIIKTTNDLVEIINGEYWIHPDLAIQLSHWISPTFSMKVTEFIRKLFSKENEIHFKNEKIQLLENSFLKKQKRTTYSRKNYIYMLTTEEHKKKGIYIIGKTTNLTQRLSGYNKSAEHEVVYTRECKDEDDLNACEIMVLNRLRKYREQSNRDRFILPIEKDITYFKKIIDSCADFLTPREIIV